MTNNGRPRLLDSHKRAEACALISAGLTMADAARQLGCSVKTLRRDAQRDPDFRLQLSAAQRSAPVEPLKLMRRAAGAHWRAAAWLLERTDPDQFGPHRAGMCRPGQVEDLVAKLIEAALSAIPPQGGNQLLAYKLLNQVAQEGLNQLFPAGRPRHRPQFLTPLTNSLRLDDEINSIAMALQEKWNSEKKPSGTAPAPPATGGSTDRADFCPAAAVAPRDKTPVAHDPRLLREMAGMLASGLMKREQELALLSPKTELAKTGPNAQNPSPPQPRNVSRDAPAERAGVTPPHRDNLSTIPSTS